MTMLGILKRSRKHVVLASAFGRITAFGRAQGGVAAVEFALFAPMLVFALLMMFDIGMAAQERMAIGQALRAGAQAAMFDPGEEDVENVIKYTAATSFALTQGEANSTGRPLLTPSVTRYCGCPDATETPVDCSLPCAATSTLPYAYYRLSASMTHAGLFLPAFVLDPAMQVQVR